MPHAPFTGQLYQLFSKTKIADGSYVEINGPHDKFGVIISSAPVEGRHEGNFLNQIRGVKPRVNERVVARF